MPFECREPKPKWLFNNYRCFLRELMWIACIVLFITDVEPIWICSNFNIERSFVPLHKAELPQEFTTCIFLESGIQFTSFMLWAGSTTPERGMLQILKTFAEVQVWETSFQALENEAGLKPATNMIQSFLLSFSKQTQWNMHFPFSSSLTGCSTLEIWRMYRLLPPPIELHKMR